MSLCCLKRPRTRKKNLTANRSRCCWNKRPESYECASAATASRHSNPDNSLRAFVDPRLVEPRSSCHTTTSQNTHAYTEPENDTAKLTSSHPTGAGIEAGGPNSTVDRTHTSPSSPRNTRRSDVNNSAFGANTSSASSSSASDAGPGSGVDSHVDQSSPAGADR